MPDVLIVHEDRRFELYRLGEDRYETADDGRSAVLNVTFETIAGPRLRLTWDSGSVAV